MVDIKNNRYEFGDIVKLSPKGIKQDLQGKALSDRAVVISDNGLSLKIVREGLVSVESWSTSFWITA